jgi:copper homeostasis protein
MLKVIKSVVTVPVFVMVRPRGGDFLYDEHEFKVMKEDMKALEAAGADGIVFGILCKYSKHVSTMLLKFTGLNSI